MTTSGTDIDVLLGEFVAGTPGARHALVLSGEGLRLGRSPALSTDQADRLAAVASGMQSLAHGASAEFGDGSGGVRQSMTEFHGGALFIVAVGSGAHLAVIGEEFADAGAIGHAMGRLVDTVAGLLSADPRIGARQLGALGSLRPEGGPVREGAVAAQGEVLGAVGQGAPWGSAPGASAAPTASSGTFPSAASVPFTPSNLSMPSTLSSPSSPSMPFAGPTGAVGGNGQAGQGGSFGKSQA